MASTIATVNQSLVDNKVQEALRYVLPMFGAFSMRTSFDRPHVQNDSVYVPFGTDPTGGTKTLGTMVSATGGVAGTQVQLSNPYGAGWDAKEGQVSRDLFPAYWADQAAGAVYVVAKAIVDAALALVTKTNFGDVAGTDKLVCAPADFGQQDAALAWQYAETKIKQRQRSFGMNAALAAAIFGDSNLGLILTTGGSNFMQTGVVPGLFGMPGWCYGGFPSNSENLLGAVFGKAAICVAVAPVDELIGAGEGNIVERRMITEPTSGLTALYTMTAEGGGLVSGEVAVLYGVAKGQDAVVRIVSQ